MTETRSMSDRRPLALMLAALLVGYAILFRLMPFETRGWALWPFGALALYCGARLSAGTALLLTLGVVAITDLLLYQWSHIMPNYLFYAILGVTVLLGRGLLGKSFAWWRVGAGSIASYAMFFLLSNFVAWLEPALPQYEPRSFATLMLAYRNGLDFLRYQPAHLDCGLLLSFGVFGLHAYLAKVYFPAEQLVVTKGTT